ESGVVFGGELGVGAGLLGELGQAEGDGFFDLLREVEVVAGDVGEERIDEVQAAQFVAGGGGGHGSARSRLGAEVEGPVHGGEENPEVAHGLGGFLDDAFHG